MREAYRCGVCTENRLNAMPCDRERRRRARALRLRRQRRKKCLTALVAVCATVSMMLICSAAYGALDTSASDGFKYYTRVTVEAGDSLWDLAGEYMDDIHYRSRKNYMEEACRINHLKDADSITEGQILILPYYSQEFIK